MSPETLVQTQLDAYNARDLARFCACFSPKVKVFRPPQAQPALEGREALSAHYAQHRFHLPALHADLVQRMVLGNKVIDHERIHGVRDTPFEAAAVYEVGADGLIAAVWFFEAQ